MLILIHNIHSGLNLNNFNVIEEFYKINDYFIDDNNFIKNEFPSIEDINYSEIPDVY